MANKKQAERAVKILEGVARNVTGIPNLDKQALSEILTENLNIIKEYLNGSSSDSWKSVPKFKDEFGNTDWRDTGEMGG